MFTKLVSLGLYNTLYWFPNVEYVSLIFKYKLNLKLSSAYLIYYKQVSSVEFVHPFN